MGSRMNPKVMSCFTDESFIGRVSKDTTKSHPAKVALCALARYVLKLEWTAQRLKRELGP